MRKFLRWFKALLHWLRDAWLFWLAVVPVLVVVLVLVLKGTDEATIRITGLLLQLGGIGTVALGIRVTRKFFGRPGLSVLARRWFGRFPSFTGRTINATANMQGISMTGSARAHVWRNPGSDATIEERIKALEENLQGVNQRLCSTQSEIDQNFRELTANLKNEQDTRAKAEQDIREKLEDTETGGLHISAMGVLWLGVGVIMSTIPTELAKLIKSLLG